MPKRGVNMHENEVMRAFKTVNDSYIEPISFIVPRRAEVFQDDIYPPATGLRPAMSSQEWFDGKEGIPPKIDMGSLYEGEGLKEVSAAAVSTPKQEPVAKAPEPTPVPQRFEPETKPASPPTVVTTPPSMKEQGASMAAAASKYKDNDEPEHEADDSSSFEEVPKPTQKTPEVSITPPEESTPIPWESKKSEPKVRYLISLTYITTFTINI